MKVNELIKQLEKVLNEAGNIDVVIIGQYAAETESIYGIITTDAKYFTGKDREKVCIIDTDLMIG